MAVYPRGHPDDAGTPSSIASPRESSPVSQPSGADLRRPLEGAQAFEFPVSRATRRDKGMVGGKQQFLAVEDRRIAPPGVVGEAARGLSAVAGQRRQQGGERS